MKKISCSVLCLVMLACVFITSSAQNPVIGKKAIELAYPSPQGDTVRLSALKGYVVLIDFWASWCGPCRRANPSVVALYNEYKEKKWNKGIKGFTVYSLSLDKKKEAWVGAIQADKLSWPYHASDLKGWSAEGAAKYGVYSIPQTFLVDETGFIIAINPSHDRIKQELEKRLKGYKPAK